MAKITAVGVAYAPGIIRSIICFSAWRADG
jgi:hypothetical protein